MTIQRMHHELKLRGNKIDSSHFKDLPTAFLDDFLNDAQIEFKEICYSGRNDKRYRLGFEITQQRMDLLMDLVVLNQAVTPTVFATNIYKIDLTNLSNYDHFLNGTVTTSCGTIPITIVTHNDLDEILKSENRKPSAIWKRCIGVFGNSTDNLLLLYTGGEFTITSATINYLKQPRRVFFGSYDSLEYVNGDVTAPSALTSPIDSEFTNQTAASLIVDIAVQSIYGRSLENPNALQLTEDKITRIL